MPKITNQDVVRKWFEFLLAAVCVFWVGLRLGMGSAQSELLTGMHGFSLLLWSILLEALPFDMLGIIISSLIQVFVTEDILLKIMPKNAFLRLLSELLAGLLFPVCECAIIPITHGLLKKGMPIGPAIAFMLATPIVNPIVLLSTYHAFTTNPLMMPLRAVCGCIGAMVIGGGYSSVPCPAYGAYGLVRVCGADHFIRGSSAAAFSQPAESTAAGERESIDFAVYYPLAAFHHRNAEPRYTQDTAQSKRENDEPEPRWSGNRASGGGNSRATASGADRAAK